MNLTLDPDEYVERLHQNIKSTWEQGAEAERERIIKLLLNGWVRNENAPIIKAIKGEQK